MSPRFRVELQAGRMYHAEYEARDAQAAEDIARFLFEHDRGFFPRDEEFVLDCTVERTGEAQS